MNFRVLAEVLNVNKQTEYIASLPVSSAERVGVLIIAPSLHEETKNKQTNKQNNFPESNAERVVPNYSTIITQRNLPESNAESVDVQAP